jgi:transposase
MTQSYADFLPLRVINVGADGKRSFDKRDKQRLIEACLEPGVSVAGMALEAGVNANQLRRWIGKCRAKRTGELGAALNVSENGQPVFVPVVQAKGDAEVQPDVGQAVKPEPPSVAPVRASQRPPLPSRLLAQLPNGVSVELECAAQDAMLVTAMIETLGRCHVPARR